MTAIYVVIEQIGELKNGNVGSNTVPRYELLFYSTHELALARCIEIRNAGGFSHVEMRELDNVNSHLAITPVGE